MPIYEYYCPTCRARFEERRPMSLATATATCEQGHAAPRTISAFAAPRTGDEPMTAMDGGGCCGGGACGCGASNN